jgi:hypothetical protein
MVIEFFQLPKKGGMPLVFENLCTRALQKHMTTLFCGD